MLQNTPAYTPLLPEEIAEVAEAIKAANKESAAQWRARINFNSRLAHLPWDQYEKQYKDYPVFPRAWHIREQDKYALHPAVIKACAITRPKDWHQLVLEWPHPSMENGEARIAYTQDDKKGEADRQTVTSIGKYLARHWKGILPDNVLRDLALAHTYKVFEIVNTSERIVEMAQEGPTSCMKWEQGSLDWHGGAHPYECYAPKYGWSGCVQRDSEGKIVGRALLLTLEDGDKGFVRSFWNDGTKDYSYSDTSMEAWLKDQGYSKWDAWPDGAKLAQVPGRNRLPILPYIDGGTQTVEDYGTHFAIEYGGSITCDCTDGGHEDSGEECEDCNERVDSDDLTSVGYYGNTRVCLCCLDNYRYAYGRGRNQYHAPEDECVYSHSDGEWYVRDYLDANGMSMLDNGDVVPEDESVRCECSDDMIHIDDARYVEDKNGYVHEDYAWQCYASEKWFSDDTDCVEVDGETYHPDYAPSEDEDPEENAAEVKDLLAKRETAIAQINTTLAQVVGPPPLWSQL